MKGISPLIASVLLIVAAIGISVALLPQIMKQTNEPLGTVKEQTKVALDCASAGLTISSVYMASGDLVLKIRNTGQRDFKNVTLYAENNKGLKEVSYNVSGEYTAGSTAVITHTNFPHVFSNRLVVTSSECPNAKAEYILRSETPDSVRADTERIGDWDPTKNLVGYWSFEKGFNDASGNNNGIPYISPGKNKIPDPSFENGSGVYVVSSGGQSGTPEIITDPTAPHGSKVAHFIRTSSGSSQYRMYETKVVAGRTYTFSAWGKTSNVVQGADSWNRAYIFGRWIYSNGTEICCLDIGFSLGTNDWERKSVTGTAPTGAVAFRYRFGLSSATGEAWMDGFQFEEGSAMTTFDDPAIPWNTGITGSGLTTDGEDDYVQIPNFWNTVMGQNDYQGKITMTAWVKSNEGTGSVLSDNNDNEGYIRVTTGSSQITVNMQGASTTRSFPNPTDWHFVALTTDGSETNLVTYVDDNRTEVAQGVCDPVAFCGPDGFLRIGGGYGIGQFNGTIDEVRIYNRALSEDEIRGIRYLDMP